MAVIEKNSGVSGFAEYAAWWQDMTQQEEQAMLEAEQEEEALPWEEEKNAFGETEESVRDLERMLERMREQQKSARENRVKTKKVLRYNHRKVSSAISGAKTLMQASNALTSAMTNLSNIRRKAASGDYDEDDVAIAKSHAMKMVRTARKKVRNLKLEGNQETQNTMTENKKRQDKNIVIERKAHQELEEELQRLKKELSREEKQYKNLHRQKENWDLMQADMEYLRRKIEQMRNQEERTVMSSVQQQAGISEVTVSETGMAGVTVQNQKTLETQQEAAQAVAEVSVAAAAVSVDVMV